MANRFLSNIRINDAYTLPASDGTNGQVISTDGAGNLSFIDQVSGGGEPLIYLNSFTGTGSQTSFTLSKVVDDEIKTFVYIDGVYQEKDTYEVVSSTLTFSTAPELNHSIEVVIFLSAGIANINQVLYFYGKASESISKGDGVMFAGVQGDHFLFAKATQAAIDANHEYFIGLAAQDLNTNDFGYVTEFGRIDGLNTDIYNEGDILWFDSGGTIAGALTSTEPVPPLAKIQVAAVLRKHQQEGTLFVRPTWYHELRELHDVSVTSITDKDILVWNNASGYWENTKVLGDITTGNITTSGTVDGIDISDFKSSYDAHTHDDRYYTETEIDTFLTNSTNWDTAYGWGDHSLVGYLTTETDPVFVASPAYGITSTNITNWNTAYGWGDHSIVGYLTSFTETDPIYVSSSWYTTTNNAANWDTAYSWGNHATQSYATQAYVNTAVANLVDTAPTTLDTLNELAAALGDDPNFATTVTTSIGTKWTQDNTKISNWDTAYTYSQVGHLPLTGGTLNGGLTVNASGLNVAATFISTDNRSSIIIQDNDTTAYIGVEDNILYLNNGATNGIGYANIFAIDSVGRVGIQTSSPLGSVHIYDGSSGQTSPNGVANSLIIEDDTSAGMSILTPSTAAGSIFFGDESDNYVGGIRYYHADDEMSINVNNAEVLRFDSSGNLGLGTSSPGYSIDITKPNPSIELLETASGTSTRFRLQVDSTGTKYITTFGSGGGKQHIWQGGQAEVMRLDNDGNLGIGTDAPSGKLDVRPTNSCNYVFTGTSTSGYTTTFNMDDNALAIGHNSGSRDLYLKTNSLERFTILGSNGNIGIGTTSPAYKLDVSGDIAALAMYDNDNTAYYIDPAGSSNLNGATLAGNLHLARTSIITFYGNAHADHSISSRGIDWAETDDIRINSYGSVFVNLDSNNNNTSLADFRIGRHGGEETISDILLTLNGENGNLTVSGDINAAGGNSGEWNTAYTYSQVGHLPLAGGTMSGDINAGGNKITNLNSIVLNNNETTGLTQDGQIAFDLNDSSAPASLGTYGGSYPDGLYLYGNSTAYTIYHTGHFSGTNIANWQTAYGWGNHASAGYAAASHTHSASDISSGTLAGARLPWNLNDGFTGTYNLVWRATDDLYTSNWLQVNGATDTLLTRNIDTGSSYSINTGSITVANSLQVDNSSTVTRKKIRNIDSENYYSINDNTTVGELIEEFGSLTGGSLSNISKVDDNTAPAPGCFELNGAAYFDSGSEYIKVDPNSGYTFEMWVKYVSGADTDSRVYAGWTMYNSAKTSFGNTQRYWGCNGIQFDANSNNSGWFKIQGTIAGIGTETGQFISGTEYVRPVILLNYNGGSNVMRVCGFKLYKSRKRATELQLFRKDSLSINSAANNDAVHTNKINLLNNGVDVLRIETPTGYTDIGSANSSFTHFSTDRGAFYFGNNIQVNGIVYDYNNTAYYLDSASTSVLNAVNVNSITIGSGITLSESADRADLLEISSTTSGWGGIQIRNSANEGRWSFMVDGANAGIYDDENNDWHIYMTENAGVNIRHNGSVKLETTSGGVSVTGALTASGDVTAFSDARLKENVETIDSALNKVNQLRGVKYNKIGEDKNSIGVIAQEIEKVVPEVVLENEDGIKSVAYGNITAVLIEAIKELSNKVEELENKLNGTD